MENDAALLRRYAKDGAEEAFAEITRRHIDAVYSTALRRVGGDTHLAEDVTQEVFVAMAQHADQLAVHPMLLGWLYTTARNLAVSVVRRERRRKSHEQEAQNMQEALAKGPPEPDWNAVSPLLENTLDKLSESDRAALLLRFLGRRTFVEIASMLELNEDAARKRVDRALDRLRERLARNGVASSSAALALALANHAVGAAPTGLAASIASVAVAAPTPALALETTRAIAMSTIQKSIASVVLMLAVGTGIYEATTFAGQASGIAAQEQRAAALTVQLRRADEQQATAAARLKSAEAQIDSRLASGLGDAALESRLRGWQANLVQLRDALKQRPNLSIPELQLLSDDDWFDAATQAKLDSDDDVRRTLAGLRDRATLLMAEKMRAALNSYLKASDGTLPDRIEQLLPYFNPPVESDWLDRYEILHTGKFSELSVDYRFEIIGQKSFGDVEYDRWFKFGPNGSSGASAMDDNVAMAWLAFGKANRRLGTAAELVPYLKWPASEAAVQKILDARKARAATINPRPATNRPSRP